MNKKSIIVLCGGNSKERTISLKTGKMIFENIDRQKYNISLLDTKKDLFKLINLAKNKKIDLAFVALHGAGGEDGKIQGLLDSLEVKYTGSGVLASAMGMNKEITKNLLLVNKLKTPKFMVIEKGANNNEKMISLPFVLKPANQGSSFGVRIIRNKKEFKKALAIIFRIDNKAMVEEYIKGAEITVAVIGNSNTLRALPVVEIVPRGREFFDYKAKYLGKSDEIVPARINKKIAQKAQNIALRMHKIIGCKDLSRTDMILRGKDTFVLEINTIPGMMKESILPKAAKEAGMEFKQLVDFLIKEGLKND